MSRLLVADRKQEPVTAYTVGVRVCEPLDEDYGFDRKYVVHGEGEHADGDAHVSTCEIPLPRTSSRHISGRFNFVVVSTGTHGKERSKPSSKLNYDL